VKVKERRGAEKEAEKERQGDRGKVSGVRFQGGGVAGDRGQGEDLEGLIRIEPGVPQKKKKVEK